MRRILRIAGRAILVSSLAAMSWLFLGTRSLFRISRRLIADEKLTVSPLEKLRISLTSPLDGQRVKFAPNYDVSQLAGVRSYESDPMNRIHWKMSTHRGELMVKEFTPSASKTVVILLNLTLRRKPSFTLETFVS